MPSAGIPLRPSFVRSIHACIARPRPFTPKDDPEEDANETSPPYILASSRGCYRADVPLSWTDLRSDRVLRDAISRTRGHHHRMESNRSNNARAGSTPHRSADSSVGDAPCRNVRGGQLD